MNNQEKIVNHFLKNSEPKQVGQFVTNGKTLVYVRASDKIIKRDLIALKINNKLIIGNSSILRNVETKFGRNNRRETEIQRLLALKVPMLPFNVFQEAKLDINKLEVLDEGPQEKIVRKTIKWNSKKKDNEEVDETIHFTGSKLFKIDDRVFLFDIDRNEVKHKIFNPFLVELTDKTVSKIKDAYESLKPQLVKDSEKKGLEVKRQGEWFFVPVKLKKDFVNEHWKKEPNWQSKMEYPRMVLQAGQNRPNYAEFGFKAFDTNYVKGIVSHSGREHNDLLLNNWYIAIPNTSTTSWQITGDID
jgi:hypothetical protein